MLTGPVSVRVRGFQIIGGPGGTLKTRKPMSFAEFHSGGWMHRMRRWKLVPGSSLTVYLGFRFADHAVNQGRFPAIINRGPSSCGRTCGDEDRSRLGPCGAAAGRSGEGGGRLGGFLPEYVEIVGDQAEGSLIQLGPPQSQPGIKTVQLYRGFGKAQQASEEAGVLAGENHPVR